MNQTHTPEQVANTIKDIIKKEYKGLNIYAQQKGITPTQLYNVLNGKEYMSLFSSVRFSTDFDLNLDYCTKGELPVLNPNHDYQVLLEAATDFFYAVRDEDNLRDEYERRADTLSPNEKEQYQEAIKKLRVDKAKSGCALVKALNEGWGEENPDDNIELPVIPRTEMKLHEAIQKVIRDSGRALTFTEIAKQINKDGLYSRKDGKPLPASQVSARVKNHPSLFEVDRSTTPAKVSLK